MIPASKSPYFVEKAIISPGRTDTEFCYQSGYGRYVQYPTQSPMCHSMVPIVCLLYAFFRRSKRCGFCLPDLPSFEEMLEDADDRLFNKINNNDEHVLHCLLPPPSVAPQHYELRQRAHNRTLPTRTGRLTDSNFANRLLFIVQGHLLSFQQRSLFWLCHSCPSDIYLLLLLAKHRRW